MVVPSVLGDPPFDQRTLSDRLTALGPFFAAGAHDPGSAPQPPWRPMSELLEDSSMLAARVETSRAYLATASGQRAQDVELRVAASITHLGIAARTLSPLLALAVLCDEARPIGLDDLRWQPTAPGSTFPLSIAALDDVGTNMGTEVGADIAAAAMAATDTGIDALAGALAEGAVGTVAADLCAATRPFGVSERVLWGNIASALNGACTALSTAAPRYAPRARAVFAAVLRHPVLAGMTQTSLDGRFQRRSCCLIYRATPGRDGMVCGDCVLLGTRRARAS